MRSRWRVPGPVRWVGLVLSWLVILAFGAALLAGLIVPRVGGGTPYVVETGSMRPELPPGTLVVTKPVEPGAIAIGDVITYQIVSGESQVVTHRVIATGIDATGEPRWRTQGDANDAADQGWVLPVQVQGREWYTVPLLGHATSLVSGQQRELLTIAAVVGLAGYALSMFRGARRDSRRTAQHEQTADVTA
ncbi:signal peptidase I [Nocardioides sp. cx-173]|uniref:signal peptidase I n=1 Tax=Nocardioides sp. cx-173 TaxID=2898796 RepID=UPI001E518615|nr:signal peptidase I [Nocardioides sp. cx-173]MCD4525153.1 signal peptidase I [Nocardioides sp. cx-173]UGB40146.1 signal peptidase I [Nocardioides sp. cx-173]